MSLSGAMNTAVSGLNAQSKALGNISDNVANQATTGYKRVETSFVSLITQATPQSHEPGGVLSRPLYMNDVQGTIQSTGITTNLAIVAGDGMFAVSEKNGVTAAGMPTFATDPLYTRAGDFGLDDQGYLVNGSGYYLNGWEVGASNNATTQIQVTQLKDSPQPTRSVTLSANLPTQPAINAMPPQAVTIYDAGGTPYNLDLNWTFVQGLVAPAVPTPDQWSLAVSFNGGLATPVGDIVFNTANDPVTKSQAGSIYSITTPAVPPAVPPTVTTDPTNTAPASIDILVTLPTFNPVTSTADQQTVKLNFGTFGVAQQLTNFTGTEIEFSSATQDGLPPGSFRNLSIGGDGMVSLNYDNGNKKTVFQIPIAQFPNYNGLQMEAGNAYSASSASGSPALLTAGANGTGSLQAQSVEGSNVDISAELVKMIQAQSAYSANARVISIANEMLKTIEQVA